MAWVDVLAHRQRRFEDIEYYILEGRTETQGFSDALADVLFAALTLDRVDLLEPHVPLIEKSVGILLSNMPRWGASLLHELVLSTIVLEQLGRDVPDYRAAMTNVHKTEEVVQVQQRICLRENFVGKPSRSKGIPKMKAAFLRRVEESPTLEALEVANCPGHPNVALGRYTTSFLAKNLQDELRQQGEDCRIQDLLFFGSRWRQRGKIAGWQLPKRWDARVFIAEGDEMVVYHWFGYFKTTSELVQRAAEIVAFDAAPHLDGFEKNAQAEEGLDELVAERVAAKRLRHVLVFDSGYPGLKSSDLSGLPGLDALNLKIADILSA